MKRRSVLGVIGGAAASMVVPVAMRLSPQVSACSGHERIDPLEELQVALKAAHDRTKFDYWMFKPTTQEEIELLKKDCVSSATTTWQFTCSFEANSIEKAACEVVQNKDKFFAEYNKEFKTYERWATGWFMSNMQSPEISRSELMQWCDSPESYRFDERYPYDADPARCYKEVVYFIRPEHRSGIFAYYPTVSYQKGYTVRWPSNAVSRIAPSLTVTQKISCDISPCVRQHMRKHTGVHQISGPAKVQWKDPFNVPKDHPLKRATVRPCTCCK